MGRPRKDVDYPAGTKRCTKCERDLPFTAFSPRSGKSGFRSACRDCHNQAMGERYHADPTKARTRHLKKYGVTLEQYAAMLANQAGSCAICDAPEPVHHALHIDHDHNTGDIRGLLCTDCNTGLGRFKDNADLLQRAADYLRK